MWSVRIKHCFLTQSFNLICSTLIIFCKFIVKHSSASTLPKIIILLCTCSSITVTMFQQYPFHIWEYIITNLKYSSCLCHVIANRRAWIYQNVYQACYVTKCPLSRSLSDDVDIKHHVILHMPMYQAVRMSVVN